MNTNTIEPVSEQQRLSHFFYIKARKEFRQRYSYISDLIRDAKKTARAEKSVTRKTALHLAVLREFANELMFSCTFIKEGLRETAYTYVDVPKKDKTVEAA